MSLSVAIVGGGNGAHAAAVDLTLRGVSVRLTEEAQFVSRMQKVFDTHTIAYQGALGSGSVEVPVVTTDLAAAVSGADVILVTVPAFAHTHYAERLAPLVQPGQLVAVLPGTFGSLSFYKAFQAAGKDITVAETNTLPYATRLLEEGKVMVMSRFALKVGAMPASRTDEAMALLNQLYDGLEPVESVLACGLNSLNPIIHVPGCILNAGRIEYAGQPFFYYTEGFSDCVVRATEAIDNERCDLLRAFGYAWDIVAHGVSPVHTDDLKEAVAGNPSFAKIAVPPTFHYRYYTEDIPYGLAVWAKLGSLIGVKTPIMDCMVTLGGVVMQQDCWQSGRSLEDLGIAGMDLETLKAYVSTGAAA